jgi:HD superfamily phosphodiesterase
MANQSEHDDKHGIKEWLWVFANSMIRAYNIDASHGITHLVNTARFAKIILAEFAHETIIPGLSKSAEEELILDAAFIHDLVDRKYMNEAVGVQHVRAAFKENDYGDDKINMIIEMITSMSFSKRVARRRAGLPMIEPGPLATAIAILVDADQLDAYEVERCHTYQATRYFGLDAPQLSLEERSRLCRGWTKTILTNRVLKYKDEYMNTQTGKKLSAPLHSKVSDYVLTHMNDDELYDYP